MEIQYSRKHREKKCAAFNWLKGVTAVLCAVVMYFAVTIGIRGYDMYKDAIAQVSLKDKVSEIRSKESYTVFSDLPETLYGCSPLCGRSPILRTYWY